MRVGLGGAVVDCGLHDDEGQARGFDSFCRYFITSFRG